MKNMVKKWKSKPTRSSETVGISLREEGIAFAQVRWQNGRPHLLNCEFLPAPTGEVCAVLTSQISRLRLVRHRCVGILTGDDYSLLQIEPPAVPPEEWREAVRWQIRDLIDYPLDEAVVDVFSVPTDARPGRQAIAYAVAAPRQVVREAANCLAAARLKIAAIDIPELAVRNLVRLLPGEERGLAFLYLGRHGGGLVIARDGHLYLSRRLNIGTDSLRELAPVATGEDLIDLSSRFNDLLDSVILEVQRSLDFYESNFALPPIANLMLAPMEADLPQVLPYLQQYLGVKVAALDLGALFDLPALTPPVQARCLTAIGGALRAQQVTP